MPPDRRKFSAREDKFQIQTPEARPVTFELPREAMSPASPSTVNGPGDKHGVKLTLPDATWELPSTKEQAPPVNLPAFQGVRSWNPSPEEKLVLSLRRAVLLALACLGAGVLGGYALPRASTTSAAADGRRGSRVDVALLSTADQNALDAAYSARAANKLAETKQLFAALARTHPQWDSLEIEAGRTLIYQKDVDAARTAFTAAAAKGSMPADAYFNLGLVNLMQKTFPEAELDFAKAVALDPSRAEFYYFWGEGLRDEGKPREAAAMYHSALLRNQYETARGLYRLKFWLSEIEADQENGDGTGAEIDGALAARLPPMEAFLAAAARDLKANDAKAAAAQMARARQIVEPDVFRVILRDPTFAQECSRPELAEFFPPAQRAAGPRADQATPSPSPAPSAGTRNARGSASPAPVATDPPVKTN